MALKASYGRYAGSDSGTGILPGRSAGDINPASRTRWQYTWDGTIPYVPNPDDLQSVDGGSGEITETLAAGLKAPYTEEYSAGIDLGISRDYSFRFNVVRKVDYQNQNTINPFLPFEAYTEVAVGNDPGPDNIVGTSDDQDVPLYSVSRDHPFFGTDFEHTIPSLDDEGNDLYTGYELTFNKQFSDGYSFMASYSNSFRKLRSNNPITPNALLYNYRLQKPEWNQSIKINGVYELPFGFQY